jgi:pyruvate/2-oxoglutarate dehydrogenase complex dihydrolipoamide acyltransferase (E2) component
MVGESLEATFTRMQEHLGDNPSLPTAPTPTETTGPRRAWLVGLGVLALLPFLWLGVLHYTLGRMIDELRASPPPAETEPLEQLRSELEELRQVVSRVEDEVGQGRPRPDRPARPARTQRPAERPATDEAEPSAEDAERKAALDKARQLARERRRQLAEPDAEEPTTEP